MCLHLFCEWILAILVALLPMIWKVHLDIRPWEVLHCIKLKHFVCQLLELGFEFRRVSLWSFIKHRPIIEMWWDCFVFLQVVAAARGWVVLDGKHGLHCWVPLVLLPFYNSCRAGRKISWDFGHVDRVVHLGCYSCGSLPTEVCGGLGMQSGPDIAGSMVLLHCIHTLWSSHAHWLYG